MHYLCRVYLLIIKTLPPCNSQIHYIHTINNNRLLDVCFFTQILMSVWKAEKTVTHSHIVATQLDLTFVNAHLVTMATGTTVLVSHMFTV